MTTGLEFMGTTSSDGELAATDEPVTEPTEVTVLADSAGNNAPVAEVTEPAPEEVAQQEASQVDAILQALIDNIAPAHVANKYLKVFIYGENGCGKTIFAAQAPNPLIVDCDKEGTLSLLNFEQLKNTPVFPVRSLFAVEKLIDHLKAGTPAFDKFETIVIDPFSELAYKGLDEQVRAAMAADPDKIAYLPEGPQYNINTEHMRQIGDKLRGLDRHVILTAHTVEKEDKKTGLMVTRSNLTPKLATTIAGMVSVVGYMKYDSANNVRTLQTAPTNTIAAKSRLALPAVMERPSFNSLLEAFNKLKDENNVNS